MGSYAGYSLESIHAGRGKRHPASMGDGVRIAPPPRTRAPHDAICRVMIIEMKTYPANACAIHLTLSELGQLLLAAFWLGLGLREWTTALACWPCVEPDKFVNLVFDFVLPLAARLCAGPMLRGAAGLGKHFRRFPS